MLSHKPIRPFSLSPPDVSLSGRSEPRCQVNPDGSRIQSHSLSRRSLSQSPQYGSLRLVMQTRSSNLYREGMSQGDPPMANLLHSLFSLLSIQSFLFLVTSSASHIPRVCESAGRLLYRYFVIDPGYFVIVAVNLQHDEALHSASLGGCGHSHRSDDPEFCLFWFSESVRRKEMSPARYVTPLPNIC